MNGVKDFFSKKIKKDDTDEKDRENDIKPCSRMSENEHIRYHK